jgi:hypothetical protein
VRRRKSGLLLQRPPDTGEFIFEASRRTIGMTQVIVILDKVRFDGQGLLHTGNGRGVPTSLIMDQTEQVESVHVLRVQLKNPPVKLLRIGQPAVLMMTESEV